MIRRSARARAVAAACLAAAAACAEAEPDPTPEAPGLPEAGPERQVALAVLAAPISLREGATVLGYAEDGSLVTLREGDGPLVCLADDPAEEGFHVACYHRSLEPFMARGRELRAGGMDAREALAARWEEARAGELAMPDHPAALYNLAAERPPADAADPPDAQRLSVLYVPDVEAERAGLPVAPEEGFPWLMFPGAPSAHVMFSHP